MEGAATCILAIPAFYLVLDFPTSPASWLTAEERRLAQARMIEDVHGLEPSCTKQSGLVEAFTDWTVWWLAIALTFLNVSLSFGDFIPTLALTMGYSESITLLLCAPPWVLGVTTAILIMRFVLFLTYPPCRMLNYFAGIQMRLRIVSGIFLVQFH